MTTTSPSPPLTSPSFARRSSHALPYIHTFISPSQNSRINCLHMPHGLLGGLMSVLTASPRITGIAGRCIDATTGPMAHRSAHVPTGDEATSTFAPVW